MTAPATMTVPEAADRVAVGVAWVQEAPNADIFVDRAFVRWLVAELQDRGDWAGVITVARHAQLAMAQGGRWDTWKRLLDAALDASQTIGDRCSTAWAIHQLGSRNLLRDDLESARADLHRALAMREADGDLAGAEASRHNLRILPLALAGVMTMLTLFVGLVALLIPSFDHPEVPKAAWILDIADEVVSLEDLQQPDFKIRLTNRGTVPLDGFVIDAGRFDVTGELVDCEVIPVGGDCALRLVVNAGVEGTEALDDVDLPVLVNVFFQRTADGTDGAETLAQDGDRRVLIHPAG